MNLSPDSLPALVGRPADAPPLPLYSGDLHALLVLDDGDPAGPRVCNVGVLTVLAGLASRPDLSPAERSAAVEVAAAAAGSTGTDDLVLRRVLARAPAGLRRVLRDEVAAVHREQARRGTGMLAARTLLGVLDQPEAAGLSEADVCVVREAARVLMAGLATHAELTRAYLTPESRRVALLQYARNRRDRLRAEEHGPEADGEGERP